MVHGVIVSVASAVRVKGQGLPHAVRVLGRDVKTRERKMQSSKSSVGDDS